MPTRREMLASSLAKLADDPVAQIRWLEESGIPDIVDELALEFDDTASSRGDMLMSGELNDREFELVGQVDVLLDKMSGMENSQLWTPEALMQDEKWREVRECAKRALDAIRSAGSS